MVMSDDALALRAKFFRGLADASRLALLLALREGEKTVSTLVDETGLTQSNVSGHLACLKDCGLVVSRQEWRHVYYRIADDNIERLLSVADDILTENAQRIADCVNYRTVKE
ncbi:MAG: metalloregulator ArsR/SmtB family transcription factor [Alicyclobacillus sp.]|uniref:ArsR/SmtB family transcription factor n=1 Tax=Alicyclobacillus suci TaxID=2816080 RepID=UPI001A908E62|nr:metalloregulator ArsR/SmtB family transcription factor [Alicyclobacillus suci]MCL6442661.1 metalloregulator ArsR/SmtB family transcription factor [Alicyclobacillus sp.]